MNIWENTVLTDQGKALQAKLLQGQTLKIIVYIPPIKT